MLDASNASNNDSLIHMHIPDGLVKGPSIGNSVTFSQVPIQFLDILKNEGIYFKEI